MPRADEEFDVRATISTAGWTSVVDMPARFLHGNGDAWLGKGKVAAVDAAAIAPAAAALGTVTATTLDVDGLTRRNRTRPAAICCRGYRFSCNSATIRPPPGGPPEPRADRVVHGRSQRTATGPGTVVSDNAEIATGRRRPARTL